MKRTLLLLLFVSASAMVFSQQKGQEGSEKPDITLYKIISADRDTTYVDTSLTIQKDYKFNYLRRDNFGLLPFSNVGQTYNTLAYEFDLKRLKPGFAAQSRHFNYLEVEDMRYFNVPTPLTELYFKTAFEQGQQLDAFFTVNTSPQFNFSIAYKGVRSLGHYQHILTSTGNFRFTTNYHTKNKRYTARAHITAQDILNQENGGLTPNSQTLFMNDNPEFEDRGRLDVNFTNAENKLEGLRFYLDQQYVLLPKRDTLRYFGVVLGSRISYEDKFYEYRQNAPFSGFGASYETMGLLDKVKLEDFNAQASVRFENSLLGSVTAFAGYTDYNYGYDAVLILDDGRIPNRIKGNIVEAGGTYLKQYRGFELSGSGAVNVSGDFDGHYLKGAASFAFNEENRVKASASLHSAAPNFNFLLYQSDYVNYNWKKNFNNTETQELRFDLKSDKLLDASVSYTGIDDYTYFSIKPNDSTPTPHQYDERVDYLKIKGEREFRFRKFALMNTVLYQQALNGEVVFKIPQFITRQSLYYEDHWFKKALFLQTGITFTYFSSYEMNAYDPVLAEFYVQETQELGGFPVVGLFFNAKVRQTRIYFKYEHINALFTNRNDYFSAPGYPFRDPVLRFGLVWNFFM